MLSGFLFTVICGVIRALCYFLLCLRAWLFCVILGLCCV